MNQTIQKELDQLRARLADQLVFRASIIAWIGVPLSLSRWGHTGWLPVYGGQIALGSIVILLLVFRNHIPSAVKIGTICGLCWVVGVIGLFSFGLLGSGVLWLLMGCFLLSMLYSPRLGAASLMFCMALIAYVGYLFVNGQLQLPFDERAYVLEPSTWASALVATALAPFLLLSAIGMRQSMTEKLVAEVDARRVEIERLALSDEITGLPTLRLARDRLEQAIAAAHRQNMKSALIFIDLDKFKAVNDEFGHEGGDVALKVVAERMTSLVRKGDTVARRSGDEFLIVLPEVEHSDVAMSIAKTVLAEIAKPIPLRSESIGWRNEVMNVGASAGIAMYPDHATEATILLEKADTAMYRAKRRRQSAVLSHREFELPKSRQQAFRRVVPA